MTSPALFPTLETARLLLKPISFEHAADYQKHFANYEVIRYLSARVPWPYPEDGAFAFLRSVLPSQGVDRWLWGLFLKTNPIELIGSIELYRQGIPENRGFWLAHHLWGQGLMTEATEITTECAFTHLGFDKLIFSNAVENIASHRVKEKTGARLLPGIRPVKFVDPTLTGAVTWELTKNDWLQSRAKRAT